MLARNPKTGAPIRILRSEAGLWRNRKTLVWLTNQDSTTPWDRWETVCVGLSDLRKWKATGTRVDSVILENSSQESVDFVVNTPSSEYKLLLLPKALVFEIGIQKFRSLQLTNALVLEECHLMYPFLGEAWNQGKEDAVLMLAAILRMAFVSGFADVSLSDRWTTLRDQGMEVQKTSEVPMPLWYITQYYRPEKARRLREIKKCLEKNAACPVIDKLVLLNELDLSVDFPKSDKIQQHIVGKRLTYRMVVEWIVQNVPDNVICVFGNADIYLDGPSWREAWSVDLSNVFLALLRWDVQEGDEPSTLFGPRNDSQDTWGVLSNSVKSKTWDFAALDFPFGQPGCDNAITVEMLRKKFLIVNPALTLKTHHLQLSNIRTYDPQAVVDKPCYMYVDPTGIHDMEPVYDLSPYLFDKVTYSSFSRRVQSVKPKSVEVFCKMMERGERYFWKAGSSNPYPVETVQLAKYSNVFQTSQGLVYGYNKIFIGKEEVSKEMWSKSELSPIHPAYESERSYAVPWDPVYASSPEQYVLSYLPKVLAMREAYGRGEFFAPETGVVPYLECFAWPEKEVPVLTHKPTVQIWCKELIQYPVMAKNEVHSEDVALLRKHLRGGWEETSSSSRWVVCIDGKQITQSMVREWESEHSECEWAVFYDQRTSPDRILEKMKGAKGLICAGGSQSVSRWGLAWALPRSATVIEVQTELDPTGEAAHLSGAAGLVHSFVIVPRASEKVTQEMIAKEVSLTVKSSLVSSSETKPLVLMPRKELSGFFGHAGDSFREMVEVWRSRGYVDVVEDPKAVQIWLGGVGKTLLYDRPTMDWLVAAPSEEQSWELALFGNPKPSQSGGPAKSWFFWPRKPLLVEDAVAKGLSAKGWSERSTLCCFYGKIENKVQEKHRVKQFWNEVCDDYQMANGATEPYKLSHSEYLERLSTAKFGLCLAGFGKKCHREVECMAMGCVPVCAPEVDMDNYANPPHEGVHYIRVSSPDEAKEKLKTVSEAQWAHMSAACKAWWQTNASAEGSWALTKALVGV